MKICVINAGTGNLRSVGKALEAVGANVTVTQRPEDLSQADRVVLPGIGAFGECMRNLTSGGWVKALDEEVRQKGKPFLGICLGMQVLALRGYEDGRCEGLGWIPGEVKPLVQDRKVRVPHMGWNRVVPRLNSGLFQGLGDAPVFYFAHSYHFLCSQPEQVAATSDYAGPVTAAIQFQNLWAVQFHPEKSQSVGLKLLSNFVSWSG